jgi:HK97 family phage prohead protease
MTEDHNNVDLPRDNLFRGTQPFEFTRSDTSGDGHLVGHFAVFNQWARIDSFWEGTFLERIAPGAFKKTFKERADQIRVLFQHGRDPQVGDKPLGTIESLAEDDQGTAYDVKMFDTSYNRDLLPGLEANQYGASFRMQVMIDELVKEPKRSDHNPEGLPERTIKEIRLYEFGPVTFPAYENATAGIRSLTDEMVEWAIKKNPERTAELLARDLGIPASEIRTIYFPASNSGAAPNDALSEADQGTTSGADQEITPDEADSKITSNGSRSPMVFTRLPDGTLGQRPLKERKELITHD